ncbi:MAG: glycosyltransferase [Candidatus Ancillula trichonymphae]|jgi:glycosyltransferase involved in cell wall biosynthesis|nr:glycosyltransferase [Candidatus Ancillula trichonymphae]
MKLSVCLAARNGEKYIKQQLQSILDEFANFVRAVEEFEKVQFEIILVDDASTDRTREVALKCFKQKVSGADTYQFVLLENAKTTGVSAAFERAIGASTGDYIFLSDQDDVWVQGRLNLMYKQLSKEKSVQLVASNYDIFHEGAEGGHQKVASFDQKFRLKRTHNGHFGKLKLKLFLKTVPFYGCTLAFKKHLKVAVLPFPHKVENAYDEWIAYCALSAHTVQVLEENTVLRRMHDNNLTAKKLRKFSSILHSRLNSLGLMSVAANRRHRL